MEQQNQQKEKEKDDKKPGIPSLRDTAQRPQFKIKGLKAGQSILERLKQFKKKDLAFILAGLGVLFMAPLAEHFLMSPDNGEGAFKEGWNVKPGAGGLGSGGSPFEPGAGGVAPGDLAGGGSDVITPLNVRDPSALIMGPGATAQPPATTSNAGQAPAKESSDWKDALSQSAAHAASAATHAATPLPPLPQMSGGGLRGLGAVSGGGGASYSLPSISAGNVPNRGGGGGSLGLARPTNGYVGARSATSAGGMDQLKARAAEAGADFNRAGAAGSALQAAAGTNMGSGSDFGGAGQGGQGMGQDKAGGQSQNKDSKSEGESLAFLAAKENQEKAIDLKWKLIEKRAMLWPDLKQKMTEELMMTPLKKFTEKFTEGVGDFMGGKASQVVCLRCANADGTNCSGGQIISKDDIGSCIGGESKDHKWCKSVGDPTTICAGSCNGAGPSERLYHCAPSGDSKGVVGPNPSPEAPGFAASHQGAQTTQDLKSMCDRIGADMTKRNWDTSAQKKLDSSTSQKDRDLINSYDVQRQAIAGLLSANDALTGSSIVLDCAGYPVKSIRAGKGNIADLLDLSAGELALQQDSVLNALAQASGQIKTVTGPLAGPKGQLDTTHQTLAQDLGTLDAKLKQTPPATDIDAARQTASKDYQAAQKPLDDALKLYGDDATQTPIKAIQEGNADLKTKLNDIQAKLNDTTDANPSGMLAQVKAAINGTGGVRDQMGKIGSPVGGINFAPQIQGQLDKVEGSRSRLGAYWNTINDVYTAVTGPDKSGQAGAASLTSVRKLCADADKDIKQGITPLQTFDQGGPAIIAKVVAPTDEPAVAAQQQKLSGDGDKQAGLWPPASKDTKAVDDGAAAANTAITTQINRVRDSQRAAGGQNSPGTASNGS